MIKPPADGAGLTGGSIREELPVRLHLLRSRCEKAYGVMGLDALDPTGIPAVLKALANQHLRGGELLRAAHGVEEALSGDGPRRRIRFALQTDRVSHVACTSLTRQFKSASESASESLQLTAC